MLDTGIPICEYLSSLSSAYICDKILSLRLFHATFDTTGINLLVNTKLTVAAANVACRRVRHNVNVSALINASVTRSVGNGRQSPTVLASSFFSCILSLLEKEL